MIGPAPVSSGNIHPCKRCGDPWQDTPEGLCQPCANDLTGHVCFTDDTFCAWCGGAA